MDIEPTIVAEPDSSDADSLVSSNDPDDLGNEQTWPTEEEMHGSELPAQTSDGMLPDAAAGTTPKIVKRIPKGMSEYQAAWIIDEEDGEEDNEGESGGVDDEVEMEQEETEEMVDMPVHDEEMDLDGRKSVAFQDLDVEEEEKQSV